MMRKNLAGLIKQERIKQGYNYAELARKMGYRNIERGMRRIITLEREGTVHPEVLARLVEALALDEDHVDRLIRKDNEQERIAFEAWLNTPVERHLIIRWMPAVYGERKIPSSINTEEEAIAYAQAVAREYSSMVWLVLSRKINIHIAGDGSIRSKNVVTLEHSWLPYTRLK